MNQYVRKFEKRNCFPPVEPVAVIRNMRIRPFERHLEEQTIRSALLDTGADFSALPKAQYLHLLDDDRIPKSHCEIRTAEGNLVPATRVKLQYWIPDVMRAWGAVYFLIWGEEFLVGRDILSKFVVQFDGPAGELKIWK